MSLDFVPKLDGPWKIVDSRDTLLLLAKKIKGEIQSRRFNPDFAVCEPLTRRYEAISCPPVPCLGLFLVGGGGGRGSTIGMANFKVMSIRLRKHPTAWDRAVPVACVYSRRDGRWNSVHCLWDGHIHLPYRTGSFFFAGRANGSLYWIINRDVHDDAALVVDEATAGASQVPVQGRCFRIIGGEDGTLRAVSLIWNELMFYARFHGGDEWVLENLLLLPGPEDAVGHGHAWIVAAHETYVLVAPWKSRCLFSVHLKTMAVERVQDWNMPGDVGSTSAYPYELPWPPILKA
ncbi:unnamed protein product [Urochloa humidicola]